MLLNAIPLDQLPLTILLSITLAFSTLCAYHIFLHPLSRIPGPWIAKITPLWLYYHSYIGDEASIVDRLHQRYGSVVRIAPNDIDIKDGQALAPIYSSQGGFRKHDCYRNFDILGHPTIFSAIDTAHRAVRAKAVVSMFSPTAIRNDGGKDCIEACAQRLVSRLKTARDNGQTVDMLDLARRLAVDTVSAYLFGEAYGGLEEDGFKSSNVTSAENRLSASAFVDTFVAVGRFFLLPNWAFKVVEYVTTHLAGDNAIDASMAQVEAFTDRLARDASADDMTYQGRLKKNDISTQEISVQCQDLLFAGTDSSGMNLCTIFWELCRRPQVYGKLKAELTASSDVSDDKLLYLRAVIKEGLRISMANPTRLPRVVGPDGWSFDGHYFPPGTSVGCTIYSMHFNDDVFDAARDFRPERWLDDCSTTEMHRDTIPFGMGPRQCIARNLATAELEIAVRRVVESGVLEGARNVGACADRIRIDEWFNSKVVGHRVEMAWT